MTMPLDLVMVRHGESEQNVLQQADKLKLPPPENAPAVRARHDSEQRLSAEGQHQAEAAGEWLRANSLDPVEFDLRLVSPFLRTLETASRLAPDATWLPSRRVVERDWGIYGTLPKLERAARFADTEAMKEASSFFARFDGGESIFDTTFRVEALLGSLDREQGDRRVIVVTHGEFMWATRAVVERLLPGEWQALDADRSLRIANCCVLHYSRSCPFGSGKVARSLSAGWRRMTDPVDPERSPYGGRWVQLPGKRPLDAAEIDTWLERTPTLLS